MDLSARNLANPTAMLLSAVAMLRHLGSVYPPPSLRSFLPFPLISLLYPSLSAQQHADAIESAVYKAISSSKVCLLIHTPVSIAFLSYPTLLPRP